MLHFQIRMPAPRKHGKGVGGGRPKSADDGEGGEEEKLNANLIILDDFTAPSL